MSTTTTTALARSGLVLLGLVLGIVVLEAGLQAAALVLRLGGQELSASWLTGNRRVLFLGDSNTYGLYLKDRTAAFPHRFQALWNAAPELPRVEVINLGYPGTNSSRVRRELPHMLEELHPDLVVVLIGANDTWTLRLPIEKPKRVLEQTWEFVKEHSRVYLLTHMIRRSLAPGVLQYSNEPVLDQQGGLAGERATIHVGDAEFSMGWRKGPAGTHVAMLGRNLAVIARIARDHGTGIVLLTYPTEEASYGIANARIRAVAAKQEIPLVDTTPAFRRYCPEEPCLDFLFYDHHPTERGHQILAEIVMERLLYVGPLSGHAGDS